ncbi:hypothetical protein HID58_067786 [Brassica napus]|uniref:Uncharacterized protein n=1 Tax=Brassica napus TaxID=3708 RepID=A0ABQ7ZJK9_BRANA|nr:hypothetical protein HID58_067786 [Brassica napus]
MATIVTRLLPFWEARNVKKGVEEAGMMSTESLLNNFLSVFRYFPLKTQFLGIDSYRLSFMCRRLKERSFKIKALILRLTMRYLKYFLYK